MEPAEYQTLAATWRPKGRWPWKGARCFSSTAASVATAPTRTPAHRCWRISSAGRWSIERRQRGERRRRLHPRIDPSTRRKIVAGYENIMPTFQGQVSEEEIIELIAFIQSLKRGQDARARGELSAAHDHAAHQHRGPAAMSTDTADRAAASRPQPSGARERTSTRPTASPPGC